MSKTGKLKPGEKPVKKDAKEIEAQRLAEEARLLEEQRVREAEEARRREIITLPTGLTLYLNEYGIQEAWKHPKPKEFLTEFVTRVFKDKDLIENFENIEISIIAEYHLYNLIFAKEELELDDKKTTVLLNLLWFLLMNNNPFYEKRYDLRQYDTEKKEKLFQQKTVESDLAEFRKVLMNHCIDNPPTQTLYFGPGEVKRILEYAKNGYFMHFSLHKYILLNKQKDEEIKITVYVDKPLPIKPLAQGLYMGKEKHEIKEDAEDELRKEAEEIKKREEEERVRYEEEARKRREEDENRLDPKTLHIIQAKLKETEDMLQKQLQDREKMLNDKLDALNPKKKK